MPGVKKIPGLVQPRLAMPRLGLSTKGKPAKNPFGANKMTIKAASLFGRYQEISTIEEASGRPLLSDFLLLRETEKEAGLVDAGLAAAGRLGSRVGGGLTELAAKLPRFARAAVAPPAAAGDAAAAAVGATGGQTTPRAADKLLSALTVAAPIGVAGGLAGYGALRGWGQGQAEVNRSMQQGFNPR